RDEIRRPAGDIDVIAQARPAAEWQRRGGGAIITGVVYTATEWRVGLLARYASNAAAASRTNGRPARVTAMRLPAIRTSALASSGASSWGWAAKAVAISSAPTESRSTKKSHISRSMMRPRARSSAEKASPLTVARRPEAIARA